MAQIRNIRIKNLANYLFFVDAKLDGVFFVQFFDDLKRCDMLDGFNVVIPHLSWRSAVVLIPPVYHVLDALDALDAL